MATADEILAQVNALVNSSRSLNELVQAIAKLAFVAEGNVDTVSALATNATALSASVDALRAGTGTVLIESTAARTLSDADNGKIILCTNAGGCGVTIPATLATGHTTVLVQDTGAGVITVIAGTGLTLLGPASIIAPYTSIEVGASVEVTKISATRAWVDGRIA